MNHDDLLPALLSHQRQQEKISSSLIFDIKSIRSGRGFTMGDDHPGPRLQLLRSPTGLEGVIDYEPGGYHPVHLGDEFQGQYQYRVIHKWVTVDLQLSGCV